MICCSFSLLVSITWVYEHFVLLVLCFFSCSKIRAQLGLKPLQIDGAKNADGSLVVVKKKQEDVHAPPVNISEVRKAEKLKEKLETRKGKRQMLKKLKYVTNFSLLLEFAFMYLFLLAIPRLTGFLLF